MDESKLGGQVGVRVFYKEFSVSFSNRLPEYCSVFQAVMTAINSSERASTKCRLFQGD